MDNRWTLPSQVTNKQTNKQKAGPVKLTTHLRVKNEVECIDPNEGGEEGEGVEQAERVRSGKGQNPKVRRVRKGLSVVGID